MPDLNDFHAFTSTTNGGSYGGSRGCSTPFLIFIIIIAVISLLGKL